MDKHVVSTLCDIKALAECMSDCNWQDCSDEIIRAVNRLLADHVMAYEAAKKVADKKRTKFFRAWNDAHGKRHYCVDVFDAETQTAISPRDHFFSSKAI